MPESIYAFLIGAFFISFGFSYSTLSAEVQSFLCSFIVTTLCYLYNSFLSYPSSSVLVLCAILFLVPGSLSVSTFASSVGYIQGSSFGIQFLSISVSIALGILCGRVFNTRKSE